MKAKVAEKNAGAEEAQADCPLPISPDAAAGIAGVAGGIVGAVVGGNVGKTNGTAVAGAAVGAALGVLATEAAISKTVEAADGLPQVVDYLQRHLGTMTTSYLSGADDLAVVDLWVEGKSQPAGLAALRLQTAREAARYLVDAYGDTAARSWFLGTNDLLDRESPAYVLRHSQKPEDLGFVVPAARQVVENAR